MPRIGVLLPVYNAGRWLEPSVRSILDQHHRDIAVLAIDDGSTDDSLAQLERIDDPRLRVVSNGANVGLVQTLRRGSELLGDCEFVARHDADDVSAPERFTYQLDEFGRRPGAVALATPARKVDERGRDDGVLADQAFDAATTAWSLHWSWTLVHPSVMMRRQAFEDVGGYRDDYYPAEDWDLWWRLLQVGDVVNLPRPMLQVRKSTASITADLRDHGHLLRMAKHVLHSLGVDGPTLDAITESDWTARVDAPVGAYVEAYERLARRYPLSARHRRFIAHDCVRLLGVRRASRELVRHAAARRSGLGPAVTAVLARHVAGRAARGLRRSGAAVPAMFPEALPELAASFAAV
jgi:hypothetical protein